MEHWLAPDWIHPKCHHTFISWQCILFQDLWSFCLAQDDQCCHIGSYTDKVQDASVKCLSTFRVARTPGPFAVRAEVTEPLHYKTATFFLYLLYLFDFFVEVQISQDCRAHYQYLMTYSMLKMDLSSLLQVICCNHLEQFIRKHHFCNPFWIYINYMIIYKWLN